MTKIVRVLCMLLLAIGLAPWGAPASNADDGDAWTCTAPFICGENVWGSMAELGACRRAHLREYIRVNAFDSTRGFETTRLSFIVQRPVDEPGFLLKRHEVEGRRIQYTIESYAACAPEGRRYQE